VSGEGADAARALQKAQHYPTIKVANSITCHPKAKQQRTCMAGSPLICSGSMSRQNSSSSTVSMAMSHCVGALVVVVEVGVGCCCYWGFRVRLQAACDDSS